MPGSFDDFEADTRQRQWHWEILRFNFSFSFFFFGGGSLLTRIESSDNNRIYFKITRRRYFYTRCMIRGVGLC